MPDHLLTAEIQPRALRGVRDLPGVELFVEQHAWHVIGGPLEAQVTARANDAAALAQLGDILRCGLRIRYEPLGVFAWWGFVRGLEVHLPTGQVITFLLSTQSPNSVRMGYRDLSISDDVQFTTAVRSLDVIRDYGLIEAIRDLGEVSTATAEAEAALLTAAEQFGRPEPRRTGYGDGDGKLLLRLLGAGRFQVLGWRFVTNTAGRQVVPAAFIDPVGGAEQFQQTSTDPTVSGVQDVGGTHENARVAMSFQIGGTRDFRTRTLTVYTDSTGVLAVWGEQVGIWSALSVTPSPIATGTIYPKYVLDEEEHIAMQVILDNEVQLARGVTYYIVLRRPDDGNHVHRYTVPFQLATAPDGYPRGQMYLYNSQTQTWSAKTPTAYMPFVVGQIEPREVQPVGKTAADAMIGQPFTVSGWDLYQVRKLRVRAVGQPSGGLYVQIRTVGTAPEAGVVIASQLIPLATGDDRGPAIGDSDTELTITFDRVALPAGVPLRLALLRENLLVNDQHHFEVTLDTSIGAQAPSIDRWSTATATWTRRPLPGVLGFEVVGVAETTEQIIRTVTDIARDLLPEVEIQTRSGRYTEHYRDGSGRGQEDIADLLERKTHDGRRLLATVTPEGRLVVAAQPRPDGRALHYPGPARLLVPTPQEIEEHSYLKNVLLTPTRAEIPKALCPVGYWEDSRGLLPEGFATRLSGVALVFIDGAEVRQSENGEIDYQVRDEERPDLYT